jgi:hypothetical protein
MPLPTPVVLNPMLALSIRCSSHPFWKDQPRLTKCINDLTEKSWRDLLHMYGEGDVGLHYLQGVCLLAQVDFAGAFKCRFPVVQTGTDFCVCAQMGGYNEPIRRFPWESELRNPQDILVMPLPKSIIIQRKWLGAPGLSSCLIVPLASLDLCHQRCRINIFNCESQLRLVDRHSNQYGKIPVSVHRLRMSLQPTTKILQP